jgi:glucose-1-phosphate thymidylyltransferase
MIGVILAGGLDTRLRPLTLEVPKALLPLGEKLMIDYVVEKMLPFCSKIVVSTNPRFQSHFETWLKTRKYSNIELAPDKIPASDARGSAIKAMRDIAQANQNELLVIACDTMFEGNLKSLIDFFHEKKATTVVVYHSRSLEQATRGAVLTIDSEGKVLELVEKPVHPKTTLTAACMYTFPATIAQRLNEYLATGLPETSMGKFIEWLYTQEPVYGYLFKRLLDVGIMSAYTRASNTFNVANHIRRRGGGE